MSGSIYANQKVFFHTFTTNNWIHIAITFNIKKRGTYLFVNSKYEEVVIWIKAIQVKFSDFNIGSTSTTNFFKGKIADLRFWTTMRTSEELLDNMYVF